MWSMQLSCVSLSLFRLLFAKKISAMDLAVITLQTSGMFLKELPVFHTIWPKVC